MTANLQSRSASISSPIDEPVPLLNTNNNSGISGKNAYRSSSIGSNFFNKDNGNFFIAADTANTSGSLEDEADSSRLHSEVQSNSGKPDLDIVGALGTLNLDEDFDAAPTKSKSTTPFAVQNQFFYPGNESEPYNHFYPGQNQGSLTPNPSVGNFTPSFGQASTPSTTWSNSFVPASAPPLAYGANNGDIALSVKPFELPDEKTDDQIFQGAMNGNFAGDMNLNVPFSSPPAGQPPFGNVLDSQMHFHMEGDKDSDRKLPSVNDIYGYNDMPGPMANMMPHHQPVHQNGMWNQHLMRNQQLDNRHMPNMKRHHRHNYGVNSGMNVHRKLHNNRRKGDDASKYANAKLEDFSGEIYSLCKDQHGCRFLQRQLDLGREATANENGDVLTNDIAATMIFNEIYLKIIELMVDPFGNYLIQKLFENVSTDQRIILVKNAAPDFIRIALDPHGTRALQKLVECISTEEESKLIIELLSPHIVSLSRDLNGNHVVQKCLQKLKADENQFIFETASAHCTEIATHRHGCCVLQRCLDHGNLEQRKLLSMKVAENATNLSLDPFGNYVVQYVLSRGDDESIRIILEHIRSNIISLSLHKFGSNVIEKSLRINKLTNSLIEVLLLNKERFADLLNDAFGNYVLQTSLDVASPQDLTKLSLALQPLLPNIKNTPHGRRIMTKIQSII